MENIKVELKITANYFDDEITYKGKDIQIAEALISMARLNEVKKAD